MEPNSTKGWFVKFGLGLALPLLVYMAVAVLGPKPPLLPTDRDGVLAVLDRYTRDPVPDVVLIGSSLTARLREEYFDVPHLKVVGLSGGSVLTGLDVSVARDRLPRVVLIEMNILDRAEDLHLVRQFSGSASGPMFPPPIRSIVASYESWLHAPRDFHQASAEMTARLNAPPSNFDNHIYVERVTREWSAPPAKESVVKNLASLQRLVEQAEMRGSQVYFYSLPYDNALQRSTYATAAAAAAHEAFPDERRWLHLDLPMPQLRWPDGIHLDERSAIIVAREIARHLTP